jgi:hypothetical protein
MKSADEPIERDGRFIDEREFMKLEYSTLREEIKETKSRIFQLAGLGIVATPAAYYFSKAYDIELLIFALPGFICIVMLLYLSESHALMRCGKYIRTNIENKINVSGWENWLELEIKGTTSPRRVDKLVNIFFYTLFGLYYFAATLEAERLANQKYAFLCWPLCGFYIAIFIIFLWYLVVNWRPSSSTS